MSKAIKTLSVPQLLILSTAAGRPNRMMMPLPTTLRARGASQQRLLTSLLKLRLIEQAPTDTLAHSWRQDEQGQTYALQLTVAGLAAVVTTAHSTGVEAKDAEAVAKPMVEIAAETASAAIAPVGRAATLAAPAGKLGKILVAVGGEAGATVDELVSLTGWQKHTTRAALTRLRQRGYPLQLIKQAGRKAYCLAHADNGV